MARILDPKAKDYHDFNIKTVPTDVGGTPAIFFVIGYSKGKQCLVLFVMKVGAIFNELWVSG